MLAFTWFGSRKPVSELLCFTFLCCMPALAKVTTWKSMGPPGGTITSIAVCPADSKIVLAGTNGAGILRSTDAGESWSSVREGIQSGWITGLKFSRSSPSVVYLATTYGVSKSTDSGATWRTFTESPMNQYFLYVDVFAGDPNIVYAVGGTELFKTTDGGSTWRTISSPLLLGTAVVFVDPLDANLVFATTYVGSFKSTNGGGDWTRMTWSTGYSPLIACFDSRADGGIYYAASNRYGVFTSTDKGSTWVSISSTMTNTFVYGLAVDPQSGAVYTANYYAGISKSTDNGRTWTVNKQGLTSLDFIALAINPSHPSDLYTSTWGDVFKSVDSGVSWTCLSSRFTAHVVSDILEDTRSSPTTIYAGTGGGVYKTTNHGQTWTNTSEGLGNRRVTALQLGSSAQTLYAATEGGFYRTTDSGGSWSGLNTGLTHTNLYDLVVVPNAPGTMLVGTDAGVYKTTDGGANWARSGLTSAIVYMVTGHPQQPDLFYALAYEFTTAGYLMYKTTDGGSNWGPVTLPVNNQTYIHSVALDPAVPDTLYIVADATGVLKSTNGGTTWESPSGGREFAFGLITVDPRNPAVLYLGALGAVYRSEDRGEHWRLFGAPFSETLVTVIVPDGDKEICVGTYSGIFSSDSSSQFHALFPFSEHSGQQLTGFAISNASDQTVSLEARLYGPEGELVDTPNNPVAAYLPGKRQFALLSNELFYFPANTEVSGWAELTSSLPLSGFFQVVGQGLDGAVAFTKSLKEFCFSRVLQAPDAFRNKAAATSVQIANPGTDAVTVELRLMSMAGLTVAEKTLEIPAHGFRKGSLGTLFALPSDFRVGFILGKVTKGEGIIGFACIRLGTEGTMIGLNAAEASAGMKLYSGQMATGPGIFSSFRLVNMSAAPRHATLYAIGEGGAQLVSPVALDVPPLSAIERDAGELFGFPASNLAVGSFRVESDGPGLVGDVVFGEPEKLVLAAAMPLQEELFRRVVFSQVANGMGLFTGLAFHVPGTESATVSIQVYSAAGEKTGEAQFVMAAGSRQSRLLTEFVPSTAGQIRGFVIVDSTQPLVAQELFAGADSMSAVPGVPISE